MNRNKFSKKARAYWNRHPIQGMAFAVFFSFPVTSLIWLLFFLIPILWNDGIKEAFVDYYEQCIVHTINSLKRFKSKLGEK